MGQVSAVVTKAPFGESQQGHNSIGKVIGASLNNDSGSHSLKSAAGPRHKHLMDVHRTALDLGFAHDRVRAPVYRGVSFN